MDVGALMRSKSFAATRLRGSIATLLTLALTIAGVGEAQTAAAMGIRNSFSADWHPSAHAVEVSSPEYFHLTNSELPGTQGIRSDSIGLKFVLSPNSVDAGIQSVDYVLQMAGPVVIGTGTVPVDPVTNSLTIPVSEALANNPTRLYVSMTGKGPAPETAPVSPVGAGDEVGRLFNAKATFTVYDSGPLTADQFFLVDRTFIGSERLAYTMAGDPIAAGPADVFEVRVPGDLSDLSNLSAKVDPITSTTLDAQSSQISRTGDPSVAIVTLPLNYYERAAPGPAIVSIRGYVGSRVIDYAVPVVMGNEPPETTVGIVPDGPNSPSGHVEIHANPTKTEKFVIRVSPKNGPPVTDVSRETTPGEVVEIPFQEATFPNRLTVYSAMDQSDGAPDVLTVVGEYSPAGPALASLVPDIAHPERSTVVLDNTNQFTVNRFTGEPLSRVFEVSVDGVRTDYVLGGNTTRHIAIPTAVTGSTVTVVVDEVVVLDDAIPKNEFVVPAERITGADRYQVAINVSRESHPHGAATVYLVSGENFADALSAAPLATRNDGPLLLTSAGVLPGSVKSEIKRLHPDRVVIVGGPMSVSNAISTDLSATYTVQRIAGADRFEVSRNVARAWVDTSPSTVYVASGLNFPDALSAGAAAGSKDGPVVLVNGGSSSLDLATAKLIRSLKAGTVKIAGGTASVSLGVENSLKSIAPTTRYGGADRFAASVAVNANAFSKSTRAFLVTGLNFPDGLAGGAWAGSLNNPVYLSTTACIPSAVISEMHKQGVIQVTLIGGTASMSVAVQNLTSC